MRKLFLAVCVVLGSAFLAVPPAHAAPPPLPPGKSKHVCDTPAAGAVRCHAQDPNRRQPQPTGDFGPAGLNPADLRNAYGITDDGAGKTIAIVVAYGYANAKTDLDAYRLRFEFGSVAVLYVRCA